MAKRKLSKAARFERMLRILDYLKRNTDSQHPITQAEMRRDPEISEFIGDKQTFNRLIKDMARAVNGGEFGYKPEKEWKLYFHDFKHYFEYYFGGDTDCEMDESESDGDKEKYDFVSQPMRIKSRKRKDDPSKRVRVDYTFMHDWFGNNFKFMYSEKEEPYDDIVKVECSPYGMVNWALQYSDRVEVLEPVEVREAVIEKVKKLNEKYKIKGEL